MLGEEGLCTSTRGRFSVFVLSQHAFSTPSLYCPNLRQTDIEANTPCLDGGPLKKNKCVHAPVSQSSEISAASSLSPRVAGSSNKCCLSRSPFHVNLPPRSAIFRDPARCPTHTTLSARCFGHLAILFRARTFHFMCLPYLSFLSGIVRQCKSKPNTSILGEFHITHLIQSLIRQRCFF